MSDKISSRSFCLGSLIVVYHVLQVERNKITSLEGGILTEQVLRPSSLTSVSDHGAARSHLRAIAAAKRKNQPSPRW